MLPDEPMVNAGKACFFDSVRPALMIRTGQLVLSFDEAGDLGISMAATWRESRFTPDLTSFAIFPGAGGRAVDPTLIRPVSARGAAAVAVLTGWDVRLRMSDSIRAAIRERDTTARRDLPDSSRFVSALYGLEFTDVFIANPVPLSGDMLSDRDAGCDLQPSSCVGFPCGKRGRRHRQPA